ncbi:hypothetical protein B0H19DRAFT_1366858 [Mycena capillaripes]|nr:hypothetical protein B0H19DRAFT_1366858 [Mycena capillaripes]
MALLCSDLVSSCRISIAYGGRMVISTVWATQLLDPLFEIAAPKLQVLEIVNELKSHVVWGMELSSLGAPMLAVVKSLASSVDFEDSGGHSFLVTITAQCLSLVHLSIDLSALATLAHQSHMPSLKFLRISVSHETRRPLLSPILNLFDTPTLSELIIEGVDAEQIATLFVSRENHRSPFPALTSLAFVDTDSPLCGYPDVLRGSISQQYVLGFPALSSLSLINLCSEPDLVPYVLGPGPLLKTITLSPRECNFTDVCNALLDGVRARRQSGEALSKFRASEAFLWQSTSLVPEFQEIAKVFDPADILGVFRTPSS